MLSVYKLNAKNYIYHAKVIIGNKKLELFEFHPLYSKRVFRSQSNVYDEAYFVNYFEKNAPSVWF